MVKPISHGPKIGHHVGNKKVPMPSYSTFHKIQKNKSPSENRHLLRLSLDTHCKQPPRRTLGGDWWTQSHSGHPHIGRRIWLLLITGEVTSSNEKQLGHNPGWNSNRNISKLVAGPISVSKWLRKLWKRSYHFMGNRIRWYSTRGSRVWILQIPPSRCPKLAGLHLVPIHGTAWASVSGAADWWDRWLLLKPCP